mgnify:CR=1 FL=1
MEQTHRCVKCGKEKPASQMHEYDGMKYCCTVCCGDVTKNEHRQKKEMACEFC